MDTSRKHKRLALALPGSWRVYAGAAAAVILLVGGFLLTRYLTGSEPTTAPSQSESLALPAQPEPNSTALTERPDGVRSNGDESLTAKRPTQPPAGAASSPATEAPVTPAAPGAVDSGPRVAQDLPAEAQPAAPQTPPTIGEPPLRQTPPTAADTPESTTRRAESADLTDQYKADSDNEAPASQASRADTGESPASPTDARAPSKPDAEPDSPELAYRDAAPTGAAPAHEEWLAGRPADHYTIQLIAGYKERTLRHFMEQHDVGAKAHAVQMQRQGRAWHVLVTGDYPSRRAARNALNRLPRELRDNGIWVRSFASLQP